MVRALLLAAVLAGCGFSVEGGSARGDGGPGDRDADVTGDAIVPLDVLPDGNATVDSDGDGVFDDVDNCIGVANPNQRDHDGDAHGDVCDRCPHLPSATDPDTDGDGVGDACDPRPGTADMRVAWFGFYDASELAGWSGSGAWSVVNGTLRQAGTNNATGYAPPGNRTRPFVMASVTIDALSSASTMSVGISSVHTGGGGRHDCVVERGSGTTRIARRAPGVTTDTVPWIGTFAAGSTLRIAQTVNTQHGCRAVQGGIDLGSVGNTGTMGASPVYVGADRVAASFDYLFVVEQP